MKAHEAVARLFEAEGVETVFALMSEDIIGLLSTIQERHDDVRVISARHEQGAAAMADGYARASDGIGVCVVGRGPAIAQTGTSLLTASNRGSRILYLVPESPLGDPHDDKAFDQEGYLRSTVGDVTSIRTPERLLTAIRDAFRRLRAGEGPLAVQVPWDILDGDIEEPDDLGEPTPVPVASNPQRARLDPADDQVAEAVELYLDSDATVPPIILAGRGAVHADAREALEALAERTNGFLATTLQAREYFSEHPYYVGFVGDLGSDLANEYLTEADFVYAVGCSLNPHTTDSGYLIRDEAKVVHVDTEPASIGQYAEVDLAIVGDARASTEALVEELRDAGIDREGEFWTDRARERIAEHSPFGDREFPETPGTVDPRELIQALDDILPADRLVVNDAGLFLTWVLDGISIDHPDQHIWTLDFVAVGQALPIGMGAAVASERTCLTFCGDAGFLMALPELETAVREGISLTIVIMNDGTLGAEYYQALMAGFSGDAAVLGAPEFADVARSMGAHGYTIRSMSDVDAVAEFISGEPDGPVVVDCKINREVRHRVVG